jgi:hypothetical protein
MRDSLLGLGVVPVCPDAFDRVLRFVQTSRDVLLSADSGLKEVVILQLRMVKNRTRGARFQSARLMSPS